MKAEVLIVEINNSNQCNNNNNNKFNKFNNHHMEMSKLKQTLVRMKSTLFHK